MRSFLAVACARLVLLVFLHLSLCSSRCYQAHDALHHRWYEPEGQLRGDIVADMPCCTHPQVLVVQTAVKQWIFRSCSP